MRIGLLKMEIVMSSKTLIPPFLALLILLGACTHRKEKVKLIKKTNTTSTSFIKTVTQNELDRLTWDWPMQSKRAIQDLTKKNGLPTSVTEDMLIWTKSPPFKRSVVYKEEVIHQFPFQHSDILQQTINYRVPQDKMAELSKLDGSLLIDRTKGELTSRNDREEMNILAFNLADKIIKGQLTTEQARREYSENADALAAGTLNPMLSKLSFIQKDHTYDPDSMIRYQVDPEERQEDSTKLKHFDSKKVQKVLNEQD
jgi:hypothetical protein